MTAKNSPHFSLRHPLHSRKSTVRKEDMMLSIAVGTLVGVALVVAGLWIEAKYRERQRQRELQMRLDDWC